MFAYFVSTGNSLYVHWHYKPHFEKLDNQYESTGEISYNTKKSERKMKLTA